jgi:hypothetical protein
MLTIAMTEKQRLGNQMFMYAFVRSVAEKLGYNFCINKNTWLGYSILDCDLGVADGKIKYVWQDPDIEQAYNPDVFNVMDFTEFRGYFQTDKYFKREDVMRWLRIKKPHNLNNFTDKYPFDKYCYINVRGTDQAFGHLLLSKSYYDNAMKMVGDINSNIDFVVITDDPSLAKKYFPDLPVFCNDRDIDFCLLNGAKYMIGAISTFAWWAGYLNDDNFVIMPKNFFGHNFNDDISRPTHIMTDKFTWIR